MSRTPRDPLGRRAFGQRLRRLIHQELEVSAGDVAQAMGYRDASTVRAALTGKSGIDADRLIALAKWSQQQGKPINLHWLLTGEASPLFPVKGASNLLPAWVTPAHHQAFSLIADSIRQALEQPQ